MQRARPHGPYRPEPRYMTFTMAMLLAQNSPADMAMRQLCNIPQPMLWNRSSFARILQGMRIVSFASVKSDVLYLIPGDDAWGLTLQDLSEPKFEYLRPIGGLPGKVVVCRSIRIVLGKCWYFCSARVQTE